MRRVFADSAFWIGLREKQDPLHQRSKKLAQWVSQHRALLIVTPFIFAETQAYFSRVPEIKEMVIRDFWENPIVRFEQPSYEDQEQAVQILRRQKDKTYSFADAVTFVVMTRLGILEVLTYDRHFHQYGKFNVIDGTHI